MEELQKNLSKDLFLKYIRVGKCVPQTSAGTSVIDVEGVGGRARI